MERNSRILRDNIPAQNTRLPLIGKIRCGEKRMSKSGKEIPASLDYFVATGSYASKFNEVYAGKPDRIQIIFISDDDFQSCFEQWEGRDGKALAGYGDGKTYYLWNYRGDDGAYMATEDRNIVAKFTKDHNVKWSTVLTINFVIPAIRGVFGVWQFQTKAEKSSINAIRNTYDEIKTMAGTVVNIPFDLCVKKATSNKPDANTSYPVVTLVPNLSAENMETLRKYIEIGIDIKRQGILTENKLLALNAENPTVDVKVTEVESKEVEKEGGGNEVRQANLFNQPSDGLPLH